MKCYNLSAAAVSLLLGFQRTSAFSLTSSSGPVLFTASPSGTKQSTSRMWGILDDMLMDDASNGSADDAASAASLSADKGDAAYASLFEELVFSTREMRLDVEERIDACGEEGFLAWLEATKESSPDPEEQAAIDEVLQTIKETQQKVQAQREEEAAQEAARLEAQKALEDAGSSLDHVIRTRMYVTDVDQWEEVGKAHGKFFGKIKPVSTMVEVKGLIDPKMMVEIEASAIVPDNKS